MLPRNESPKSFVARLRGLFGRRSRVVAACILLLVSGMPIRPEEVEQHMHTMRNAKIAQALEDQQQPSGDPPDEKEMLPTSV